MFVVNTSLQYPCIQSWDESWEFFDYLAVWPPELNTEEYFAYNGFVHINVEEIDGVRTVVSYTPDVNAWNEWKENHTGEPAPDFSLEDRVIALETGAAEMSEALDLLLSGVTEDAT